MSKHEELLQQLCPDGMEYKKLKVIMPQLGAQIIFEIPWGHIRLILDKTKANLEKALYYAKK